ncbi:MAG: radical SAM protein [Oligoflexia bacterium]|nr:radical SAM protein [Oligoflexia bacterium]
MMKINKVRVVRWDITQNCNLNCIHCLHPQQGDTYIPLQQMTPILNNLKKMGLKQVNLSGREPTTHPQILEIIEWCKKEALEITLNTNGSFLPITEFRKLLNLNLNSVTFSLDGVDGNTYQRIRGKNYFESVKNTIKESTHLVKENGLPTTICINFTLNSLNINTDPSSLLALAQDLNIQRLEINPLMKIGRAYQHWDVLSVTDKQLFHFWERTIISWKDHNYNYQLLLGCRAQEYHCLKHKHAVSIIDPTFSHCNATDTIYLDYHAKVSPCFLLSHIMHNENIPWSFLATPETTLEQINTKFKDFFIFVEKHQDNNCHDHRDCHKDHCETCPIIETLYPEIPSPSLPPSLLL